MGRLFEDRWGRARDSRAPWRHVVAAGVALAAVLAQRSISGAEPPGSAPIVFELVKASGLDFTVEPSRTDKCHQPETMISGVALLDYDGDGLLDVFLLSGATMPGLDKTLPSHSNRLFRNLGGFRFEDVTERAGLRG